MSWATSGEIGDRVGDGPSNALILSYAETWFLQCQDNIIFWCKHSFLDGPLISPSMKPLIKALTVGCRGCVRLTLSCTPSHRPCPGICNDSVKLPHARSSILHMLGTQPSDQWTFHSPDPQNKQHVDRPVIRGKLTCLTIFNQRCGDIAFMTPDRDVTQLHSRVYLDRRQLLHEVTLPKTLLGANPPHPGKIGRHESSRASVCAVRSGVFVLRGSTFLRGVFCWFTEAHDYVVFACFALHSQV